MNNNKTIKTLLPHLYFLSIPLFIFRNLLGRGYILAMDMIFTPGMNFDSLNGYGIYSEIVRDWILFQGAKILPADIIQKIILLSIFYLSGIFMFKLLKRFKLSTSATIIGATFYAFNPFVYTRLIAGQWAFLLGYALMPLFYNLLIDTFDVSFESREQRSLFPTIIIWILVSMISVHHYALFAIIFVLFISNKFILAKKHNRKKIFTKSLVIFILASIVSLAWIPFSISNGSAVTFATEQLHYFAPTPDKQFGTIFNLMAFYGFWAEKTIGTMPKNTLNYWYIIFFILLTIAIIPFLKRIHNWLKNKSQTQLSHNYLTLLQIALIGIVLSLGSFGVLRYIWVLFYDKIPLLQPFRDTQKFLNLYVFVFGVGLSFGISNLQNIKLRPPNPLKGTYNWSLIKRFTSLHRGFDWQGGLLQNKYVISLITLSLIFTYTHSLSTLNHELALTEYPDSWYRLEKSLDSNDKILVLPWEPYSFYQFVGGGKGRHIANPAISFFSTDVISNTQLSEFSKNATQCDIEYVTNDIDICLDLDDSDEIWEEVLRENGIKYVVEGSEIWDLEF